MTDNGQPASDGSAEDAVDAVGAAEAVVDAVGAAWSTYGLYPDPEQQDAFVRALDAVQAAVRLSPLTLEVGAGHLMYEGAVVDTEREGSDRFARQCYVHEIESLRFSPELVAPDLITLFRTLNREHRQIRAAGGIDSVLKRDGVAGISAVQRPLLKDVGELIVRSDEVEAVIGQDDPEAFAQALMEEAVDLETLADLFLERYQEVLGEVTDADVTGRELVVRAFVEAFFHFPEVERLAVFRHLTSYLEDPSIRMLIDQFAGHELARLAPHLDETAFATLMEYARLSTDMADRRSDELLALMPTPGMVEAARSTVAASVQKTLGEVDEVVEAVGESFQSIRGQMPDPRHLFFDALEMFRAMLHVEERDARFSRLLRIWTGKIDASIRRGEYRRGELWLHTAIDHPTYDEDRGPEIESTLAQFAASDASRQLIEAGIEASDPSAAFKLLLQLGPEAVGVLIDRLTEEQDAARRRVMLDGLTEAARRDPAPIVDRLEGAPWYLARNLAVPLGRSGHSGVTESLVGLLHHDDHRVRLEAARALVTLLGDGSVEYLAGALSDESSVVRQAAAGLLAGRDTQLAQDRLAEALFSSGLDASEKVKIIELLGDDLHPESAVAIQKLAGQKIVLSAGGRSLRSAAQDALKRRGG